MPTYEYIREDGTRFEFIQKMSDPVLSSCPETGQKVRRVISGGSGVIYKGTGFYNTDYKNNGKPAPKEESTKAESEKIASKTEATEK